MTQLTVVSITGDHKPDLMRYNERMHGSMDDKLFFLSKVPDDVTVFADFGCADGALLRTIGQDRKAYLLGYDTNTDSIEAALARSPHAGHWTPHMALFAAQLNALHKQGHKSCLILSSVIHEVLSSGTTWHAFWKSIRALGCDYIAIRDMGLESDLQHTPVEPTTEVALMRGDKLTHWLLYGVQNIGSLASKQEMYEGLLKYDYEDTEKEYAETYLSLTSEQWHNLVTIASGYQLRHFNHYSMPYHVERWQRDFGVTLKDATHVNILLKRV